MNLITSDDGYWSNEDGWVYDRESATKFTETNLDLPIGKNVRFIPLTEASEFHSCYYE